MKGRERVREREKHRAIYKNLERKVLLLGPFRKGVMGNKLGKLALQGVKNDTNPTELWK